MIPKTSLGNNAPGTYFNTLSFNVFISVRKCVLNYLFGSDTIVLEHHKANSKSQANKLVKCNKHFHNVILLF